MRTYTPEVLSHPNAMPHWRERAHEIASLEDWLRQHAGHEVVRVLYYACFSEIVCRDCQVELFTSQATPDIPWAALRFIEHENGIGLTPVLEVQT